MSQKPAHVLFPRKKARLSKGRRTNHIPSSLARKTISSIRAQFIANEYSLLNYAVGYKGSTPRRVSLMNKEVWIVPLVLTSPGYGIVGEVGVVIIDAWTSKILGATRREEVRAAGNKLAKEKRDEIDAAFHRARAF
jgi:hypothetical protein